MQSVSTIAESHLDVLRPLVQRYGVRCSLEEFHAAVNLVFHDIESEVYDQVHSDMWQSLPAQFNLIAGDIGGGLDITGLRVLDIGCGTGLSSELLLRSPIGKRIRYVHLLDTSPRMLERAAARISARGVQVEKTNGLTNALAGPGNFDIVMMCSVLHHVPDLGALGREISRLQRPGGFFIHFQDPNADAAYNTRRTERKAELQRASQSFLPKPVTRVLRSLQARVLRQENGAYLDRVNDVLLKKGIIRMPMTPPDIWSVTDIHVGSGDGISVDELRRVLPRYELMSQRSYGFFSQLQSRLPAKLARKEEALIASRSLEGFQLAAAWRLVR